MEDVTKIILHVCSTFGCLKLAKYILMIDLLCLQVSSAKQVSPENSLVYGPGLKTLFVMPVRYFFIQAVDENGNK